MCDGTNSFWCENGICNEIIQGENYTCTCNEGFAGEHCELEGIPCGDSFCYHSGQCVEAEGLCDCPAAWRGSPDCSSPSNNSPTPIVDSEPVKVAPKRNSSLNTPAVLMGIFVAVAVSVGLICLVRSLRKRSAATTEFHKLQQVQMRGFIEEDEEAFSRAPLSKAEIA
ncbi:hypothetical protein KP509_32G038500 [Ceratopteris richardii]|nr:hypothetical protein KP509_32G038500 [Ceratopteris richardii]